MSSTLMTTSRQPIDALAGKLNRNALLPVADGNLAPSRRREVRCGCRALW
jgi:hypothetical protein